MIYIYVNCCSCLGLNENYKKVIKGEREREKREWEREREL